MKVVSTYVSEDGKVYQDQESCEMREEILAAMAKLQEARNLVVELQELCPHTHIIVKARSDTGNYDRSDDSYWFEGSCTICNSQFRYDQAVQSILRDAYNSNDPRHITVKE